MRTLFYTHNYRSKGARALRNGLGIRTFLRERQEDSRVTIRPSDVVINWGSASCWPQGCEVWNDPGKVNITGNKLLFFKKAWGGAGFKVPKWTTDPAVAADWNVCVSRTDLRGSQGAGIVITERGTQPPEAPLYTRYIKKDQEWRVHVAFGQVIDVTRKIRDPNREVTNWSVRSLSNGFIFARQSGEASDAIKNAAVAAVEHFGLDFGAVDIITTRRGNPYVLEINTAPALINTTAERYIDAFQSRLTG